MPQKWKPKTEMAKAVWMAGFSYSPEQDIIYSRMDAWQRKFGYAYSYDIAAPASISAIIDCEPFFFHYGGKHWMIELWKGQYGLETGAEIGIYNSDKDIGFLDLILGKRSHDPDNGKFFNCALNSELLMMSFTLERNGNPLFTRGPEKHWWLTGFNWGVLSKPEELVMKLRIEIPASEMREAFVNAVEETGYQNVRVDGDSVSFTFDTPRTHQPRKDMNCKPFVDLAEENNKKIVAKYRDMHLPNNDPNEIQDDMAAEFIGYFTSCQPGQFKRYTHDMLTACGYELTDLTKALESVFSPNLLHRIIRALSRPFRGR